MVELTDSVVELIDCLTKSTAEPVKISLWVLALGMCERYIYIFPSKLPYYLAHRVRCQIHFKRMIACIWVWTIKFNITTWRFLKFDM